MPSDMVHASDGGRRALPLSWGGWAWEFLRRNPEYQSEWKVLQAQGRLPVHFSTGDLEVRRISGGQEEAARWGLLAFRGPLARCLEDLGVLGGRCPAPVDGPHPDGPGEQAGLPAGAPALPEGAAARSRG